MSGVITAVSVASLAAGIGGTVYGAMQSSKQASAQKKALQSQTNAQNRAEQATLAQRRSSEVAQNSANMKTPDIAGIIARAAQSGAQGLSGTMLTGPTGVDPNGLQLGKNSLLGS